MTKEQARKEAWAKFCPPKDNPRPPNVTEHLAFIQGFDAGVKYASTLSAEMQKKLITATDALDKLSRLGNGEHLGNSDGNVLAQKALAIINGE